MADHANETPLETTNRVARTVYLATVLGAVGFIAAVFIFAT